MRHLIEQPTLGVCCSGPCPVAAICCAAAYNSRREPSAAGCIPLASNLPRNCNFRSLLYLNCDRRNRACIRRRSLSRFAGFYQADILRVIDGPELYTFVVGPDRSWANRARSGQRGNPLLSGSRYAGFARLLLPGREIPSVAEPMHAACCVRAAGTGRRPVASARSPAPSLRWHLSPASRRVESRKRHRPAVWFARRRRRKQ